jgi:glycyl-tRNA synthetase
MLKANIKAIKEVEKQTRFMMFNEQEFVTTNPRVMEYKARERENEEDVKKH